MQTMELTAEQFLVERDEEGKILNPRGERIERADVADLLITIPAFGRVLVPLIVKPQTAEGLYPLRDGYRRLAAAGFLGGAMSLPALIVEAEGGAGMDFAMMLALNTARQQLKPSQIARGLIRLVEDHQWNEKRAAEHTGFTPQEVLLYCDLGRAPEKVQNKVDSGAMALGTFKRYLARLPQAIQETLADMPKPTAGAIKRALKEAGQPQSRMLDDESLIAKLNQAAMLIEEVLDSAPFETTMEMRIKNRLRLIAERAAEAAALQMIER